MQDCLYLEGLWNDLTAYSSGSAFNNWTPVVNARELTSSNVCAGVTGCTLTAADSLFIKGTGDQSSFSLTFEFMGTFANIGTQPFLKFIELSDPLSTGISDYEVFSLQKDTS